MSRAPSLRPEHAALVRELRQAYPRAALPELAMRLGTRLGLGVSTSALHRFMQAHQVQRLAWDAMRWPRDADLAEFARKGKEMALAQYAGDGGVVPDVLVTVYLEDLSEVFRALLMAHADQAGALGADVLAYEARAWLAGDAA